MKCPNSGGTEPTFHLSGLGARATVHPPLEFCLTGGTEGSMSPLLEFLPMLLAQQLGRQKLQRVAEPSQLTDAPPNVAQYDRVMTTKLAIAYAGALEVIYRARSEGSSGCAVDLACGPGHFTLCLGRFLGYRKVVGIDLSKQMIEVAKDNVTKQQMGDRVDFEVGDATQLNRFASGQQDLTCFTDAAHHMPDLGMVTRI